MRAARVWTALALLLRVCSVYSQTPEASSSSPVSSSALRISRSSTSSGGSKSYFIAETEPPPPSSSSPPPPLLPHGFVWPTEAPSASSYSGDSREEATSSKAKVQPFKTHYTIRFKPPKHNNDDSDDDDDDDDDSGVDWGFGWQPLTPVVLTVEVGARIFVRAMAAEDMANEQHLVAKVVVRGDSRELVDAAVDVVAVELPVNASAAAAFRLQMRRTSPSLLTGRLLVQVLLNTKAFQLQRVSASSDSVVVVEESALVPHRNMFDGNQELELLARNSSRLLVRMPGGRATSLVLQAHDEAALVVQSSASLSVSDLQLRQRGHATLALVTQRLWSNTVGESMESSSSSRDGGALCVHSVDTASVSVLEANVSANGALLQWASSASSSMCSAVTINATGDGAIVDVGSLRSSFVNVVVRGEDSLAVVNSRNVFASAVGATARVANVARPSATDARIQDTRCSLESLASQFPLPLERAVSVALANGLSWGVVSASPVVSSPPIVSKPGSQPEDQQPSYQQPKYQQPAYYQPVDQQKETQHPDSQQDDDYGTRHDFQQRTQREIEEEAREEAEERAEEEAEREAQKQHSQEEHPSTPPSTQPITQPDPQLDPQVSIGSSAPADKTTGFVNGSLHMLGSIPYVDAIVVFLVSAWILHHLLQCYDRRQRRRQYTPLVDNAEPSADRVWI